MLPALSSAGRRLRLGAEIMGLAVVLAAPAHSQEVTPATPSDAHPADAPAVKATVDPTFKSDLLSRVVDGETILPARWQNREEVLAYEDLVLHARRLPTDVIARAARRDVPLPLLLGPDKSRFRGQIVRLTGSLRMLQEMAPSQGLVGMAEGLDHVYRGWLALDGYKDDLGPVLCAVDFTELPAGLKPNATTDRRATVDGFFFKVIKYDTREPTPGGVTDKSPDGKVYRLAPLFIARTVQPGAVSASTSAESLWTVPAEVIGGTIVLFAAAVGAWFVVSWWMKREDARVRARLRELRPGAFGDGSAAGAGFAGDDPSDRGPFDHTPSAN
jgi:hypothetical protein